MPHRPAGKNIAGESAYSVVGEHDLQLAKHHVPILAPDMPMLFDAMRGQVEHFAQGIVIGERRLVLGYLTELAVEAALII